MGRAFSARQIWPVGCRLESPPLADPVESPSRSSCCSFSASPHWVWAAAPRLFCLSWFCVTETEFFKNFVLTRPGAQKETRWATDRGSQKAPFPSSFSLERKRHGRPKRPEKASAADPPRTPPFCGASIGRLNMLTHQKASAEAPESSRFSGRIATWPSPRTVLKSAPGKTGRTPNPLTLLYPGHPERLYTRFPVSTAGNTPQRTVTGPSHSLLAPGVGGASDTVLCIASLTRSHTPLPPWLSYGLYAHTGQHSSPPPLWLCLLQPASTSSRKSRRATKVGRSSGLCAQHCSMTL